VLIPVQRLVDRLAHGPGRAEEVAALRLRLVASRRRHGREAKLCALADELRRDREQLAAVLARGGACSGCARGHPLPAGRYPGGHCCSGKTEELFDEVEIVALSLSGVAPRDLRPARGEHAGCAFRGPSGCTLPSSIRPNRCLAYTCPELEDELRARGALGPLRRIRGQMMRRRLLLTQALAASALPAMQAP
jgi:hypothetical protein